MNKDEAVRQAKDAMDEAYDITVDNCTVPMKIKIGKETGGVFGYYGTPTSNITYEVDGGEQEYSRFEKMHMAIAQMINNNLNVIHLMKGKKKHKPIVYDTAEELKLNLEMDKSVEDGLKEVEEARKKL